MKRQSPYLFSDNRNHKKLKLDNNSQDLKAPASTNEYEKYASDSSDSLSNNFNSKLYIKKVLRNKPDENGEYKSDLIQNTYKKINTRSRSKKAPNIIEEVEEESNNFNECVELLPCREKEQDAIYSYVKKGLQTSGSYTALYISGMPGTGKTACVITVLNRLKKETRMKKSTPFSVCEINGMKITNPSNVFKYIYEHVFTDGRTTNLKKCSVVLDNFFKNRQDYNHKTQLRDTNNSHIVLIIDEIDCLINNKQILLYNIFNWTTYVHSKLIIISISNTLDLPEKLLPKISSRIGNNRLSFKPYQREELIRILSVKIENFDLFTEDAIKLSSMKVAAVTGDLRRTLQISRRAKEIFESESNSEDVKIDKSYILRAIDDLFGSKVQYVIKSLQLYEKITLAAILFQMKLQMNNKVSVVPVYDRLKYFYLKSFGKNCHLTFEDYTMIIYNLVKLQIISFQENFNSNFINNTVNIKFYVDEFTAAMDNDKMMEEIMKELS